MSTARRVDPLSDPEATFQEPRFLLGNIGLSNDEKIKILLDWRQDLLELEIASQENMPSKGGASNIGARLKAVTDALISLGYKSP